MKNKLSKIISSLLILSFLIAAFSVFSFAEDTAGDSTTGSGDSTENMTVLFNRTFEDGWDYKNGFQYVSLGNNNACIDFEEDALGKYNYYVRFEALSTSALNARINFGADAVTHGSKANVPGTVVEFSVKADDVAKLGNIVRMTTAVNRKDINMLDINADGELVVFKGYTGGDLNLGVLGNEWVNIAYIFDWQQDDLAVTVKVGYGLGNGYTDSYELVMNYTSSGDLGMYYLYFGIPTSTARADKTASSSKGMSFCMDNLKVYQGVRSIQTLDVATYGYGSGVNTLAEKVIDIQESAGVKSKAQLLEDSLAMKVGVEYALIRNVRYSLLSNADRSEYSGAYGAPAKQGDNVLVPLQLVLDYIGFPSYIHPDGESFDITTGSSTTYITLGRDSATVDGERIELNSAPGYLENGDGTKYLAIALDDVPVLFPGWLAIYDDMGLIIIYEDQTPDNTDDNEPIVNRSEDLTTMVDIMKKFVFDTVSAEDAAEGYTANGELIANDTKKNTNSFTHPYIMANASTFSGLAAKYALTEGQAGYNATLKAYIKSIIDEADAYYAEYANAPAGVYAGIKEDKEPSAYTTSDGYDVNGKMPELVEYASILPTLAFAYQITGNANYAKLAYDWSVALGQWSHWGPGYFVHCAETASYYSIAYDWLYNAYKSLGLDTDVIANAIYELAVHDGYISSIGKNCEHARSLGDLSAYVTKTDHTNAVGTAGMIISSLAILDYVNGENAAEGALDETLYLLGNNIQNLITYGLDIYAPDGSYIESPTEWEYGTSNLFRMIMALTSATGTDYGLMNTWGLDKTCYYAVQIESSDGYIWNYNESYEYTSLNPDMMYFVGSALGDSNLLAIRNKQLEKGKAVTVYDLLYYPAEEITEEPELSLDYTMEAMDAFVSRSDWSDGAMYTGLMGGMNNVTNGQIDSGNFIYHNKGIIWVMDLGAENPAVSGYDTLSNRYKYYRASAEGHNVVLVTSQQTDIAYGQYSGAGGVLTKTFENEHGSYAILNNSSVYLSIVSYANRGILITNDRNTVVVQDELSFVKVQSVAWVMHTAANVSIDDTGRVAYLTQKGEDGKTYTLRATLVSQRPDFVFTKKPVNQPLLTATTQNGAGEYSRDGITRLSIEATTISFDVAIVFEMIENAQSEEAVGYEWTNMVEWEPAAPKTDEGDNGGTTTSTRPTPNVNDIKTSTSTAESILKRDTAFTERLSALYNALVTVEYTLKSNPLESLSSALQTAYADYLDCLDEYDAYREYINANTDALNDIIYSLNGFDLDYLDVTE